MKRNTFILHFLFSALFSLSIIAVQANKYQGAFYLKAGFPQVAKPLLMAELNADSVTIAESCYYLGNIYSADNLPDSAAFFYKKGLSVYPLNSLNAVGLSMLKMKSNLPEANQEISNVLKMKGNKKNIELQIAIAYAYLANGLYDEAITYQEAAKKLKGKYAGVYVLLGDILLAKKDVGNACGNYEQAIMFDAMCREAYIKYARAYKGVNPQLSIEKLGQLKEKDPSFLLVDKELADIYYTMNKFDEAVKHYEIYLQSGNSNTQDKTKYAMTLFLKQDYNKSLEVAKLGLEKAPRNPAFNRLAMYNNVALKNHTEGLKYADFLFNKSDKVDVNYFDYTYYGQALRETKQFDLAITQYKNAFKVDSTKIDLLKEIANMHYEKRDSINGIASQEKYISLLAPEKRTGDVLFAMGKIYYGYATSINDSVNAKKEFVLVKDAKRNVLIKADTVFAQLSRLEPTAYRADFWRARVNFALDPQNSKDIAKGFYEKTLSLAESKADVKYNPVIIECARYLGFYYYMKSDFTQSKVYWTKIIAVDPNNAVANKALTGMEKQKSKKQ